MNFIQRASRRIIRCSFHLSVKTIEQFYDMDRYRQKAQALDAFPEGTLGKDIADCLRQNNLQLVPRYESHDLKHVLLGFRMNPVDEIRMQAFMLGNGNYSLPCFAIFLFGALLLPDLWSIFYQDYKRGRKSKPIIAWTIEAYAHCSTEELRSTLPIHSNSSARQAAMRFLIKAGAYLAIVAGVFGMVFCLPYLFSSNTADLIGAGFPFLGGAILTGSGLIAVSNLNRQSSQSA